MKYNYHNLRLFEKAIALLKRQATSDKDFNYRIGSLTEYFKLADVDAAWDDLRQMQPKVLEPVELDVLEDNFISSLCRH